MQLEAEPVPAGPAEKRYELVVAHALGLAVTSVAGSFDVGRGFGPVEVLVQVLVPGPVRVRGQDRLASADQFQVERASVHH